MTYFGWSFLPDLVVLQKAPLLLRSQVHSCRWTALFFFIFLSSHGTICFLPSLLKMLKIKVFLSFRMNVWIVFRILASMAPSVVYRAGWHVWCGINWGGGCFQDAAEDFFFALKLQQKSKINSWAIRCHACWYHKHTACSIDLHRIL